jgi:hypothetical protein
VICEALYSIRFVLVVILGWAQGLNKNRSMFGYIILSGQFFLFPFSQQATMSCTISVDFFIYVRTFVLFKILFYICKIVSYI